MRISARSDYALRAAAHLALHEPGELVKGEQIAAHTGTPRKFLEAILRDLRTAGLIVTQRGADGGYGLAREPSDITVHDVLSAIDSAITIEPDPHQLVAWSAVWRGLHEATNDSLRQLTLAELAGRLPQP